ncbi:two-component system sensor histidine kinase NtrB [Sphingomonas solaris]|uniref:histidine kinase n=1 Tax=Alterirhizorhabdus solaris TaxID=2529389 RepID=A0A558R284_9SPHN|nr:ATP-binding protein [Sphingomonas solaris]TVV73491.1 PAS domain-containing protein [Sphingomonas solaris]
MALPRGGLIRFGRRAQPATGEPGAAELLAALPVAMLAIDPQGRITDANIAAETLLNLAYAGIVGRPLEALIGRAAEVLASEAPCAAYDIELALPDGRRQRVDLMAAPLPERADWKVVTIHLHVPAHLVARAGNRAGGGLTAVGAAAMLAHEIKNPLSGIRGAAQLLETTVDEGSRDLTRLIRDEVDRVAALIDRMEGFTDTRPLTLSPQNIHAVLGRAREVALQGFARGRAIREAYDPSLPAVLGHHDSLIQILINLMKNAAEASGGAITLRTAYRHGVSLRGAPGDSRRPLPIEVCVIDEGPGAPAGIADHLFDPFVTSKRSGGGLGLALVDKLVADHGGIVEYAREGTPPRTVFRLLLPRASTPA